MPCPQHSAPSTLNAIPCLYTPPPYSTVTMSDAGPSKPPIKKTKKVDRSKGSKSHGARSVKKERNADELVELDRALEAYVSFQRTRSPL